LTGYALLDHDDESGITAVGFLCARYAYLATWDLRDLLGELARHPVSLAVIRSRFRDTLVKHSPAP
jgi:hypothetical protein